MVTPPAGGSIILGTGPSSKFATFVSVGFQIGHHRGLSHERPNRSKDHYHIRENIKLPKKEPRLHTLKRTEGIGLDSQAKKCQSQWLRYSGLRQSIQAEL